MKLSKEQRTELAEKLSTPYGAVVLMCDGIKITLEVRRWKSMTYRVMTFINGKFEWKWTIGDVDLPEHKFLRKQVRKLSKPSERAAAEKALGKRWVKKSDFWNKTITFFNPDWASGKAAINHLCKVCESVEVFKDDTIS